MKLDSKYFDSIRSSPRAAPAKPGRLAGCEWKGCAHEGTHRAPKGRGREGQYFVFCIDHVREYNASYNYFDGMSDAEVSDFQKDAVTGHRPTWKTGANAWAHGIRQAGDAGAHGPYANPRPAGAEAFFAWRAKRSEGGASAVRRKVKPLEGKALEALNLEADSPRETIKARFKELVKRHHPDANGGDKRSEDKLREIIQAYNYLKQAGRV